MRILGSLIYHIVRKLSIELQPALDHLNDREFEGKE